MSLEDLKKTTNFITACWTGGVGEREEEDEEEEEEEEEEANEPQHPLPHISIDLSANGFCTSVLILVFI